ncbi:MAG: Alpha-D-glucose 1-phosphate phosphatase YihX [Stenotrophomonas maltophilia]|uniref:Alpha-D-glucose 1-phosphate phosphatase YihX n=1 Tax=Stenotrophomonas maltophilia TaxID=40324 RepID=A0A7V8FFG4_STEMA|nr:MAG: Alpha-D-glucose 1-phosphate phosphatase YihX [Stenotrophomonas maltophilia]
MLHLARALGVSVAAVQAALYDSGLEAAHDSGALDGPTYLAQLGALLGCHVDVPAWTAARQAASHPQQAVLQRLQTLQVPLAVLTNNGALMAQALPMLLPGLFPALQGRVFCSAGGDLRKPHPAVFQHVLAVLGVAPAHTLFVDDLFTNVRGARGRPARGDGVRRAWVGQGVEALRCALIRGQSPLPRRGL